MNTKKGFLVLALIITLLIIITIACGDSSTTKSGDVTIPAGKLNQYLSNYPSNKNVYVEKKDGTTDNRPDDLEELCKDWLYYGQKIIEAESAGRSDKAADYRESFQQVNVWLSDYYESDVTAMFEILERQGYSPP
jgi:hypothetical protein